MKTNIASEFSLLNPTMQLFEKKLLDQQIKIEAWFREHWRKKFPPFYCSVDIRNAGFKIAPVDTNLFPAGFNNLNPKFMPLYIQAVQATVTEICSDISQILIVPENHTRNLYYWESVAALVEILSQAGLETRIGSLINEQEQIITSASGKKILIEPLKRQNDRAGVDNFFPHLILLNNDLTSGLPKILENVQQKILPPVTLGWSTRLKSTHFTYYQEIAEDFAKLIDIDPWLIVPLFRNCGEVNFMTGEGEECMIKKANYLLEEIKKKYQQYNIQLPPFITVKADSGTYGMAVMMVQSADELQNLNRKQRTHMSTIKEGKPVTKVLIQEGVYTFETKNDAVAEPVVYMIGRHVVGGFYRVHATRGKNENLNAPGAYFEPLAFEKACNTPIRDKSCNEDANLFYVYGVIARLALLAATKEMEQK